MCSVIAWAPEKRMLKAVNGLSVAETTSVPIDVGHTKPEHPLLGGEQVVDHEPQEGQIRGQAR